MASPSLADILAARRSRGEGALPAGIVASVVQQIARELITLKGAHGGISTSAVLVTDLDLGSSDPFIVVKARAREKAHGIEEQGALITARSSTSVSFLPSCALLLRRVRVRVRVRVTSFLRAAVITTHTHTCTQLDTVR